MSTDVSIYEPRSLGELENFASRIVRSGLVPQAYRNKPEDAIIAMMFGKEVAGLGPITSLQFVAVIGGRPGFYSDAVPGIALQKRLITDIHERLEGEGDATTAICVVTKPNGEKTERRFSVADAKRAGLWGKSGPWSQYPQRMLAWRAKSWAVRDAAPHMLFGATKEEIEDALEIGPDNARDITPKPVAVEPRVELVEWIDQHGETRVTTAADQAREMLDIVASGTPEEIAEMVRANPTLPHVVSEALNAMIKVYAPSMAEPHSYCPTPRAAWSKLLELEPKHGRQNLAALNLPLIESLLDDQRAKPETRALLREWLDAGESALNTEAAE